LAASPNLSSGSNPLTEATRNLTASDKERLAGTLYNMAQWIDKTVKLSDDASREVGIITNEASESQALISKEQTEAHRQNWCRFWRRPTRTPKSLAI
jgi:hypothetical protein